MPAMKRKLIKPDTQANMTAKKKNSSKPRSSSETTVSVRPRVNLQTYLKNKTMAQELNLSIAERVAAVKIFDDFKGSISQLSQILEDVKAFVVTEADWKAAGLKKIPQANGTENWTWEDAGTDKVVKLGSESLAYLAKKIKEKNDAGEITLADKALITLEGKLK